ncbi:MAG: L-threonylcarbamoyladenylate synthase [Segniliparus sp.]|uniref:L-threonylcarbamoyladenylate synthase n=1 Tax=Segniliparus sp. TaxID=2804064 RepID=UPI003F3B3B78
MSIVYDCSTEHGRESGVGAATAAAQGGHLVVIPTDTVYGLGCDAFDQGAVAALLAAKGRGRDMPTPVLVGSWATIEGLASTVTDQAWQLVHAFWPGPLSLVLPVAPSLAWDLGETRGTVMVRMPLHPVALQVLGKVGPMAVSSANRSGQAPAKTAAEAKEQLGDSVAVYLESGAAPLGEPSTILDLSSGGQPRVLREGALSSARIAEVLGVSAL